MAKTDDEFKILNGGRCRKSDQKLKSYLLMKYLFKHTDEEHTATSFDIVSYLEDFGISAERRSIYKDIEEINKALLMLENEIDILEAEEMLADDVDDEEKFIVYDKRQKGFYVKRRLYDLYEIQLLAECIYSARFLEANQAERLVKILYSQVSEEQAEKITHNAFLTDRVKTNNSEVINNITIITEAMSKKIEGKTHTPEKISFKYQKYSITDKKQISRRHGEKYIVSPFALLINDGNYYLLAFDDKKQKMINYRVDRMKNVEQTGEKRTGEDEFSKIDLKSYTKKVFSMFNGNLRTVEIRFINPLLDTVIERFGTGANVFYSAMPDNRHFIVKTDVEVSKQFFGWICGFGNKAKILNPPSVVDEMKDYINTIQKVYEI